MRILSFIFLVLFTSPLWAAWQVAQQDSSIHFLSTKNAQITEIHQFDQFSGDVSDKGELKVSIELASVNTNIGIRNERMQKMLFEVADFPTATITANVRETLAKLSDVTHLSTQLPIEVSLHGHTMELAADVAITRINSDSIRVTSVAPVLLDPAEFGLEDGIAALQEIAGLSSITRVVPVTFDLTFRR